MHGNAYQRDPQAVMAKESANGPGPIKQAIIETHETISMIDKTLEALVDRLDSILGSGGNPTCGNTQEKLPASCQLEDDIQSVDRRLMYLHVRLDDLVGRIQL